MGAISRTLLKTAVHDATPGLKKTYANEQAFLRHEQLWHLIMTWPRHYPILLIWALTVLASCAGPMRAPFEAPAEEKALPAAPSGPLASVEQRIQTQAGAAETTDNLRAIRLRATMLIATRLLGIKPGAA